MAVHNTTDPAQAQRALSTWLAGKLPAAERLEVADVVIPASSGLSNETILFSANWSEDGAERRRRYVARVQPAGPAVHPFYDLAAEARLLRTLHAEGTVPVPEVHWHEPDAAVLGAPFTVMTHVEGRVPSDDPPYTAAGWLVDRRGEQRATLSHNALAARAAIHRVDWRAEGLEWLDQPRYGATGLDQQLGYVRHAYDWTAAGGVRNPTVEAGFQWVRDNRPSGDETIVLTWGDARIGNMLFAPDLSVAAVLDWELAALAGPEMDLGWWLFLQRHHTAGIGMPLPTGLLDRDAVVTRYHELTGYKPQNIDFYEIFATLRGAIQMQRVGGLLIDAGLVPPEAPIRTANPANILLAVLLGLPAPEGAAQSWIGNR
jgi:aminoglycoside phosphotransferase (APT) family kinase protein